MALNDKDPLASRLIEVEKLPWIDMGPGNRMKVLMHDTNNGMLYNRALGSCS